MFIHFDTWQFPLWIADISWVGLELVGALVAIVSVVAVVALMAMGLVGVGIVALVGTVLALLFGFYLKPLQLLLLVRCSNHFRLYCHLNMQTEKA